METSGGHIKRLSQPVEVPDSMMITLGSVERKRSSNGTLAELSNDEGKSLEVQKPNKVNKTHSQPTWVIE